MVNTPHFSFACSLVLLLFSSPFTGVSAASPAASASAEVSYDGGGISRHVARDTLSYQGTRLNVDPLAEMQDALSIMQDRFFEVWLGQWSTTIDWTGAVVGTYLSACISSILHAQHALPDIFSSLDNSHKEKINESSMDKYFSQVVSYYFGENAFDIRNEAYDDMLWVVLGWLESLKFIKLRSNYAQSANTKLSQTWWGEQFSPAFAHRAHVFYDLAKSGWDERLCGGGMTWNSNLMPYKNTITNTLFISASVNMYLYHPGDQNASPYSHDSGRLGPDAIPPARKHDRRYLTAAITGYDWLKSVNMTNELGLYVDGYHISNWRRGGTICDVRSEEIYTYNQGVLLSGLRGLWESTGNGNYLENAHELVRNVIAATGWSLEAQALSDRNSRKWSGLGSQGILTERCDPSGSCSQDGQTFKGIFFHHLTALCAALPVKEEDSTIPGTTYMADSDTAALHRRRCTSYIQWVSRNALAALSTKNDDGLFGMWWGATRNERPKDDQGAVSEWTSTSLVDERSTHQARKDSLPSPLSVQDPSILLTEYQAFVGKVRTKSRDVNDRGRGRTVETQSGGLMVVRALYELLREYGDHL